LKVKKFDQKKFDQKKFDQKNSTKKNSTKKVRPKKNSTKNGFGSPFKVCSSELAKSFRRPEISLARQVPVAAAAG
jgi:hypothetical protein